MANTTERPFSEVVRDALTKEVRATVEAVFGEEKQAFLKRLENEKDAALAALTLHFMREVDIQTAGERVIITLRKENKK